MGNLGCAHWSYKVSRESHTRPTEPHGTFGGKFKKAFEHLRRLHMGPFRFLFSDARDALYLQAFQKAGKEFLSLVKILRDGTILFGGPHRSIACVSYSVESIAGAITLASVSGALYLPSSSAYSLSGSVWRPRDVQFVVKNIAVVADIQCDIYQGAASILDAPVTLQAAGCPYEADHGVVSDTDTGISSPTLRVAVGAGGTATELRVDMFFDVDHPGFTLEHPGRYEQ